MAELTEQDRKNYEKLKTAFGKLAVKYDSLSTPIAVITTITTSVNNTLIAPDLTNDTSELRKKVDLVDGYLEIRNILLRADQSTTPQELNLIQENLIQEIVSLNEELKRSLKIVEDETLDLTEEIEKFQPDSLFLQFITKTDPNQKQLTEDLINDLAPRLNEDHIRQLTNAWGDAVTTFVEDARQKGGDVTPLQPETFAQFFRIHKELEVLYSRLADSETVRES